MNVLCFGRRDIRDSQKTAGTSMNVRMNGMNGMNVNPLIRNIPYYDLHLIHPIHRDIHQGILNSHTTKQSENHYLHSFILAHARERNLKQ